MQTQNKLIFLKSRAGYVLLALLFFFILKSTGNAQFVDLTRAKLSDMTHDEWATQVVATPSGKEIISAGVDGRVVFWDAATGKVAREISLPTIVLSISLSSDGRTLAAGDASGKVSLINVETAKVNGSFIGDKKIVNTTAWSEDGKFLAAGGSDGIVRIWSAADGKISSEINPAHGDIMALAFAKSQLVIGLRDGKERKRSAEVWDWQNKKVIRTFDEGAAGLRAMAVSPDGKLLAIADYQQPTLLTMMPTDDSGGAEVSLRVLPETDESVPVAIWDLTTGKRAALIGAETGARSIAFSPDGQILATAGTNGVMFHEIALGTFTEIGRLDSMKTVDAVAFSPDSKQVYIAREREPLIKGGAEGTEKLVDPFFTSIVMQVRQGINSGVLIDMGAKMRDPGQKTKASFTGGSNIEAWAVSRKTSQSDIKTWEAVRAIFDDKPDEAKKALQQTIKDFPNYGEAQRLYALFFENKDLKKVLSLLDAAVKTDPSCVTCWRSLGDLQMKIGQPSDAVKNYDKVLQLKPEYGLVVGHKAEALGATALKLMSSENTENNMKASIEALTQALTLRPGVEQFYTNLGAAFYFRGDFDSDISLLLIAKRLRPDHARIYYNLGHAYRQKGDKQRAIEAYKRYVQMGEEGEEARVEKAKDFIKQLSK